MTATATAIHCDAVIGQTADTFGFRPVHCGQVVGIRQYEAAAPFLAHLTVGYCSRDGHRASVERRYPPLDTVPEQADPMTAAKALHDRDGWPVPEMHNIGCPARYPDVGGDCDEYWTEPELREAYGR